MCPRVGHMPLRSLTLAPETMHWIYVGNLPGSTMPHPGEWTGVLDSQTPLASATTHHRTQSREKSVTSSKSHERGSRVCRSTIDYH
jgi:hypothetical protein